MPNALPLPFYHRFSHDVFDDRKAGYLGVGQAGSTRIWDKGLNLNGYPGICYQGTPQQWAYGALTTDPVNPRPKCCQPTIFPVKAGLSAMSTINIPFSILSLASLGAVGFVGIIPAGSIRTVAIGARAESGLNFPPSLSVIAKAGSNADSKIAVPLQHLSRVDSSITALSTIKVPFQYGSFASVGSTVNSTIFVPMEYASIAELNSSSIPILDLPIELLSLAELGMGSTAMLAIPPQLRSIATCGEESRSTLNIPFPYLSLGCSCGAPSSTVDIPSGPTASQPWYTNLGGIPDVNDPEYGLTSMVWQGGNMWVATLPDTSYWTWYGVPNPSSPSGYYGVLNFTDPPKSATATGSLSSFNSGTNVGEWAMSVGGSRVSGLTVGLTQAP